MQPTIQANASVAGLLAGFLNSQGVTHIFGLPGGENVLVIEALRQAGLQYVLLHHEASAGFAADVTGQLSGRPGVCLATLGPGAVNLLATAAGATLERSPVVAITATIDERDAHRVTHMQVDLPGLFGAVTKGSRVISPQTAGEDILQAWELALTPPRGAAHLALSPETAGAVARVGERPPSLPEPAKPDPHGLAATARLLQTSRQVFLLAGLGVDAASAHQALYRLAEAWNTPVAVTPKAKGQFPERHQLYAGCYSAYGDEPLRQAMAEADLILGVGLDGVDFVTSTWNIPTPLVNMNLAMAADPVTAPAVALEGDLTGLLQKIQPLRSASANGPQWASRIRTAITRALDPNLGAQAGRVRLLPLIEAIQHTLPPDGAITLDVGAFKLVFLQAFQTERPKSVFVANGLSAMGYALPGAMAIKLAQPQRRVMAILGDGALLMYAGELETLARLGKPVVVLVVVDEALALIRLKQLRQTVPIHGTEFGSTDYAWLARSFGLKYRRISGESDAAITLQEAFALDEPVLVEARVNVSEYDHYL